MIGAARQTRTESDSLGSRDVPADVYWGIHTLRALENYPISKRPISVYPELVVALAAVKQAACRANLELGDLDPTVAGWIDAACQRIIDGELHDEFVVGVIQGGAGTSTNMNANEVIANFALEIGGHPKGRYDVVHPIDDVNRSQSTNDTYPTAIKLAMTASLTTMLHELESLRHAFARKGVEFHDVLKVGRTQLQDAVPMTLGQEFHGFATTLAEDVQRLRDTVPLLSELNLGATAIGTGITADPGYTAAAVRHLCEITGRNLASAPDLIEATSDTGVFMTFSGALKRSAIKLSKICNDLRLLSSGPQAGLGEINLPARAAGSSIMPGKVNPIIPEAVSQVAYSIAGADVTVTMAAESGQLQLNAFEPVIAHSLLQSIAWMRQACWTLRVNCVDGITANAERLSAMVHSNVGVVTALIPFIGYAEAAQIAKAALHGGGRIADLVVDAGLMSRDEVEKQLQPERLSGLQPPTQAIDTVAPPDAGTAPPDTKTAPGDRGIVSATDLLEQRVRAFLKRYGLVPHPETAKLNPLAGGVSSDIWLAEDGQTRVIVKTPLATLRVTSAWQAPVARSAAEAGWLREVGAILPGVCPPLLAFDDADHMLAMGYLEPAAHVLWKSELLAGRVDPAVAAAVGERIGIVHARTAAQPSLAARFANDDTFVDLRMDAYLAHLGRRHPALAGPLQQIIDTTMRQHRALVHGDVSPKNILIGPDGPVFVDAETAVWGDPAFDVAFCLNHLVLKCAVPGLPVDRLLASARALVAAYVARIDWEEAAAVDGRVAALLPALMLARIDGKSPVEYFDESQRTLVRAFAEPRIRATCSTIAELCTDWQENLG